MAHFSKVSHSHTNIVTLTKIMNTLAIIGSLCIGLGLSASCGFRVFVPLLMANVAALVGIIPLAENMAWLGSWTAFACLATATVVEIVAYYIPWIDNLLDTITTPSAMIAGTMLTASVLTGVDPAWQWGLGIIVGGGSAGITQLGTSSLRLGSSLTTGGVANPLLATVEHVVALLGSILAIFLPMITAIIVLVFFGILGLFFWKKRQKA